MPYRSQPDARPARRQSLGLVWSMEGRYAAGPTARVPGGGPCRRVDGGARDARLDRPAIDLAVPRGRSEALLFAQAT